MMSFPRSCSEVGHSPGFLNVTQTEMGRKENEVFHWSNVRLTQGREAVVLPTRDFARSVQSEVQKDDAAAEVMAWNVRGSQ